MRKKWSTLAIVTLFGVTAVTGTALAAPKLSLYLNQQVVNNSDLNVKAENGTLMVPLKKVVEMVNGKVTYSHGRVDITVPNKNEANNPNQNLERQLRSLENALLPQNAAEAAQLWIRGVQNRNGAMQFAVMSPELRSKTRSTFDENYWVTGGSSPHMAEVDKLTNKAIDKSTVEVSFDYPLKASNWSGSGKAVLTVKQMNNEQGFEGWLITRIQLQDPEDTGIMIGAEALAK